KDGRALRTRAAPTGCIVDDIGQTGENIAVRPALPVEVRRLRSIVLRANGHARSINRARGHAVNDECSRMRAGGRDRGVASGGEGLTRGLVGGSETSSIGGAGTVLSVVYQSPGSARSVVAPALTITGKGAEKAEGFPEVANAEYAEP